jgi:hypothetical protein
MATFEFGGSSFSRSFARLRASSSREVVPVR